MKTVFGLVFLIVLVSCSDYEAAPRNDFRDRILGTYDVEEYSTTYAEHVYYSMYVSKSHHSAREVMLENFYIADLDVYAVVDDNFIRIPFQTVDGYEIEGSGRYHRGELQLDYSVRDRYSNSRTDYCQTIAYQL